PIVVARKPLVGTVAQNVLAYGTGALNIDANRIGESGGRTIHTRSSGEHRDRWEGNVTTGEVTENGGRWPTNVLLDDSQAAELDAQTGVLVSNGEGGASRFFPVFRYEAKAPTEERPRYHKSVLRLRDGLTPEQVDH